jgi:cell wall-associated NlpC family hydrolase
MDSLRGMTEQFAFWQFLISHLGVPYVWGGSSRVKGLDCSGFAQIALAYLDLDPPGDQTAAGLMLHFQKPGNGLLVDVAELGTLCFYGGPNKITHVAIALDKDRMIEAGGGDSKTKTIADARKRGACVRIRPIRRRQDLVAMYTPAGLPWNKA